MRQGFSRKNGFLLSFLLVPVLFPANAYAQWSWPDSLENMKVLPSHWTGERLAPVMRGFSRALGVRCQHCHDGAEGAPLSEIDFVSDANPNKDRARAMLRMLRDINGHLSEIEPSGDQRVNMWCTTCHAGRARPMTIAEEMGEAYRANGIQAAIARYDELREEYYGQGAYNFGEDALNAFGYSILEDDLDDATQVFHRNTELFPESANVWDSLGEAYRKAGDTELATLYYSKALVLEPRLPSARTALQQMREVGN